MLTYQDAAKMLKLSVSTNKHLVQDGTKQDGAMSEQSKALTHPSQSFRRGFGKPKAENLAAPNRVPVQVVPPKVAGRSRYA